MAKKTVHTVPNSDGKGWVNKYGGKEISHHRTKDNAVDRGRDIARDHHTEHNLHNRDGRIAREEQLRQRSEPAQGQEQVNVFLARALDDQL
jgi:Uncharacterized protein conserved in bacteria (DUF2188)